MDGQIGKRSATTSQLSGGAFWHVEKVAFGQQVLPAIYLQETLPFQHHASYIHLDIDVQRDPFSLVKSHKVAVQVGAFQRKEGALGRWSIVYVKKIDDS